MSKMTDRAKLRIELKGWCRGMGISEAQALLVVVPEGIETEKIEETLESVKCLGRVRVRGRTFNAELKSLIVLCECKEAIPQERVPTEVIPSDETEPWPIILSEPALLEEAPPPLSDLKGKLEHLLEAEGKTVEDLPSLFSLASPASGSTESVLRAVGELFEKARKPSGEGGSYRRLRLFSGLLPTPAGEESFEQWKDQAHLMIEESDCSRKEKRKRLMESLKGPALEIVKAARVANVDVTPEQCLESLEDAFGSAESGDDLYFAFRLMKQREGEKLSEFLRRLEHSLLKVVERDGLPNACVDKARVEQLLRGAVSSDIMLVNLRVRERKSNPPTFLQLLKEIRVEEEYEASRAKLVSSVNWVQAQSGMDWKLSEMQSLKSEMKELKSLVAAVAVKPLPFGQEIAKVSVASAMATGVQREAEVTALKKQVQRLQQQLDNKITEQEPSVSVSAVEPRRTDNPPRRSPVEEQFCYRCGEDGHFAAKCPNSANQGKVIRKLIQALRIARDNQADKSSRVNCEVKKSAVTTLKASHIPDGLVGPPSIVPLRVNGNPCKALLDSGSQVTIIFECWYQQHLSDVPIFPVSGLNLWGLSDSKSSYPYRGYVVVDVEYPAELVGSCKTVSVLALICPTPHTSDQISIIIGTNANHVKRLVQQCREDGVDVTQTFGQSAFVSQKPFSSTSCQLSVQTEDEVGCVKWQGPGSLMLAPGQEADVACEVELKSKVDGEILMVDASTVAPLPAGVLLKPMVVPGRALYTHSCRVLVKNESLRETAIPVGTVVGNLHLIDSVTTISSEMPATSDVFDAGLISFGDSPVTEEWKERLRAKLSQRSHVFSLHDWDVGLAKGVEHRIRLMDARPFRQRSRRLTPADIEDVRKHLQDLLQAGIIKESRSPYASPIVIVRKKNGAVRMCIDYRLLNSRTVPDQYTTPCIDEVLNVLSGSKWFSVLDLRSGYYQIAMNKEDQEKTAFICPLGFFEFERMPQGITGAPATFQRLMEKAVGDMNLLQVIVYLDDLIVFGRSLEEHEERLLKVLDRLGEVGLKLSPDKCQICLQEVKYLGHIVSVEGVSPDPSKIEAVTHWPKPTNLKTLQSFLGFCGYYRRFIAKYAAIVRPLTEITKGYGPRQKSIKPAPDSNKTYMKESEPFGSRWDQECDEAFHQIIHCLTHAPVLAFADPQKPYILHVDASLKGLGAVLYQEYPEGLKPVAFASRKLKPSERNYHIHQLEFLSLKWAVVDKLHDYLYGARFTVRTDNNPLTYVLTTAKLNAVGHRWLAALSTYEFDLQYRPGRQNTDADLLSRNMFDEEKLDEWVTIPEDCIKSICHCVGVQLSGHVRYVDQLGAAPGCVPDIYSFPTQLRATSLDQVSRQELKEAQEQDDLIGPTIQAVKSGKWFGSTEPSQGLTCMKRELGKLTMKDGLLCRLAKRAGGEEVVQLALPKQYQEVVLRSLHDDLGHLGVERTINLIRSRFFWPKMSVDVETYIKNCGQCVTYKSPCQRAAALQQISSSGPMDLVCIDFLSMEPDSKGISNVLVVTDHFTRYAQAFPTRSQKAHVVAKVLLEKFFVHYGLPARIHSDQGRDFESRLIREMLGILGIRKSRTTPYHPQGDPQPERFNRTLLSMLGTLNQGKKRSWSQHVSYLVHAYNSTKCDSTGYSPYYLMFGREARLPVDLCFGTSPEGVEDACQERYVMQLKKDLQEAYKLATEVSDKRHLRNKRLYDKTVRVQSLEVGDRVLLRNLGLRGKHKLESRWNPCPYVIVGKMPNLPVFQIQREDGIGVVKTIHRDHLLPINTLVRMPGLDLEEELTHKPRTRADTRLRQMAKTHETPNAGKEGQELSDSSDSDYFIAQRSQDGREELPRWYRDPPNPGVFLPSDDDTTQIEAPASSECEPEPVEVIPSQTDQERVSEESGSAEGEPKLVSTPIPRVVRQSQRSPRSKDRVTSPMKSRPRRTVKPVVRLTYDKPGSSRDQAITIIHGGITIQIGHT